MARPRQIPRTAPRVESRGTPRLATDLSQLLRARSFAVEGPGSTSPAVQRLIANLQASGATLDPDAAAWIGVGTPPTDRLTISLGEAAGNLGPHSYGFLNNLDGICALSTSVGTAPAERPRRGRVGVVVPRRDALPEILPLLSGRDLGISWVISVGDADPTDVLRFLSLDPATSGILLALGQGVSARGLLDVLSDKPTAVFLPPHQEQVDRALLGAVARRSLARVTDELEEWLAHGALLDVGARPRAAARPSEAAAPRSRKKPAPPSGRTRTAVFVLGAGGSFVKSEVERQGLAGGMSVQSFDLDDVEALRSELRQATLEAHTVLLCGPAERVADLRAAVPTLHADPAQPERLRAVLSALAAPIPALFVAPPDADSDAEGREAALGQPLAREADAPRLAAVIADLPPPLYVGAGAVSDEQLGDHDAKRLLHAYGARVLRQAPVATANAALKLLPKLELPVRVLPVLPWQAEVAALAAAEARDGVLCHSQAEVKRYSTLLLGRYPLVVLRETRPPAPRLRVQVSSERGIGLVLRLAPYAETSAPTSPARGKGPGAATEATPEAAALLPMYALDAEALAADLPAITGLSETARARLVELLAAVSSCAAAHQASLELLITADEEPAIEVATAVLRRPTARA